MIDEQRRWRPPIDFPTGVTHREALRRLMQAPPEAAAPTGPRHSVPDLLSTRSHGRGRRWGLRLGGRREVVSEESVR